MRYPTDDLAPGDRWGPFADGLDPAERRARFRCLISVIHILTGPRGKDAIDALRYAESFNDKSADAMRAFMKLEPVDRRRVWASYAAINRPRDAKTWTETVAGTPLKSD